jgi:hypothetical protein
METKAEKFWYGWLKVAGIIVVVFGILLAIISQLKGFLLITEQIARIFFLNEQVLVHIASLQAWMIGIIGATTAGWGVTLLYLILIPLKRKEKWAWNAIFLSLLIWFVIDTSISTYYGAKFNVFLNIALLLQFLAPLLFIRTNMKNPV